MKKCYLKRLREVDSDEEVNALPCKKRGRPYLLGNLEFQLQSYLSKIRDQGGVVSAPIDPSFSAVKTLSAT